jgi:CRISPR-associated protein Csb2
VRLTFEEPVAGPVLLGRLRYLGMGLFIPLKSSRTGEAQ